MGPRSNDWCPYGKGRHIATQGDSVETQVECGMMSLYWPKKMPAISRSHQKLGRVKDGFFLTEENMVHRHLDIEILQNMREQISLVLIHSICGNLLHKEYVTN